MEQAILKTLIYSDLFDFPLKSWEIHKWLIQEKSSLSALDSVLKNLVLKKKINSRHGLFFLKNRDILYSRRIKRLAHAQILLKKAEFVANILKIIPWIRLLGLSGGLSMNNVSKSDDIDLFVITSKQRLWLSRFLIALILEVLSVRRKQTDSKTRAQGKVCVNMLVSEVELELPTQDIYTAHEVLQMKVMFARGETYRKFLFANSWVFDYLPNWISGLESASYKLSKRRNSLQKLTDPALNLLDKSLKAWQLKIMQEKLDQSRERLEFYPNNYREQILKEYQKRIKRFRLA